MTTKTPEALELAMWLDAQAGTDPKFFTADMRTPAAACLRRQHQQIEALRKALGDLIEAADGVAKSDEIMDVLRYGEADKAARDLLSSTQPTFYGKGEVQAAIAAIAPPPNQRTPRHEQDQYRSRCDSQTKK